MDSETHNFKAGCGLQLHITKTSEGDWLIKADKSGTCKSSMWQCFGLLISELPKDKAVKILRGFECDKGIAGTKSCMDKIAKMMEGK